jgi:hypothetical protein
MVQLISVSYSLYLNVGDRTNGIQTRNEESWLIYFKPYTELPSYWRCFDTFAPGNRRDMSWYASCLIILVFALYVNDREKKWYMNHYYKTSTLRKDKYNTVLIRME